MTFPNKFAAGGKRLFIKQTVTLGTGESGNLGPAWNFVDAKFPRARLLYGIRSSGTLASWRVRISPQGSPVSDDAGIPVDVVVYDSPPQIAAIDLTTITIQSGETFDPQVWNDSGSSETLAITWVFEREE